MTMIGRHIGQYRQLEEGAAMCHALAAADHLGAFLDRVRDQRADHRARLKPIGDLHRPVGLGPAAW
jgi:hypothetical protein